MNQHTVTVGLENGLHLRAALIFVKLASSFASETVLRYGGKESSAKNIIQLLSLAIPNGAKVEICANGADENAAVERLNDFLSLSMEDSYERL